jgi:hypothetical protein
MQKAASRQQGSKQQMSEQRTAEQQRSHSSFFLLSCKRGTPHRHIAHRPIAACGISRIRLSEATMPPHNFGAAGAGAAPAGAGAATAGVGAAPATTAGAFGLNALASMAAANERALSSVAASAFSCI